MPLCKINPKIFLLLFLSISTQLLYSQPALERSTNPDFLLPDRYLYHPESNFHTSVRPYLRNEVNQVINYDSILLYQPLKSPWKGKAGEWIWKKVFYEDLIQITGKDFHFAVNPLVNFEVGRDFENDDNAWVNTRGFMAEGNIGSKFFFATRFYENQATFISYIDKDIQSKWVIPQQGAYKGFKTDGYDFSRSEGYISFSPNKYFNFRLGHGRNFFGDGYRSLLLGDAHFPYPYFLISTQIWRIKYINLYAEFMDRKAPHSENLGYRKKYGTFHYLTTNITNRLKVGLFEAIIWQAQDSTGYRGFDINYLNPIIFYRPVEFSIGSPDNALMGLNISYTIGEKTAFYGQLLLDEFKLKEVTSGKGWWANKQAFQIGVKWFDIFQLPGLDLQAEVNVIRPYTYSHSDPITNYGHYSEPLAHPMGANLVESQNFIRYHHGRWHFVYQLQRVQYGADTAGLNFGKDIFLSYSNHPFDYGNYIGQGLKSILWRHDFKASWIINPAYNLNLSAGIVYRQLKNDLANDQTLFIYIGLSTSLEKLYYDF